MADWRSTDEQLPQPGVTVWVVLPMQYYVVTTDALMGDEWNNWTSTTPTHWQSLTDDKPDLPEELKLANKQATRRTADRLGITVEELKRRSDQMMLDIGLADDE